MPGADLRYDLGLDFMEAVSGTETEIEIEKREICPDCEGNGCEKGTEPETCRHCNGIGQLRSKFRPELITAPDCG
jgi:molecular chaperone DnaJ